MTTDDERRRVARILRGGYDVASDACGRFWLNGTLFGLNIMARSEERIRDGLSRLADLIEPEPERTCRVEFSHEVEGDGCYAYFEYELTCGHEMAWGDQLPPSYCPECGRRVLYDSDKYL